MLIEDSDKFALVIPTYQGTPYLRRCMDYLDEIRYGGYVVLADDSAGPHRDFVERAPRAYPRLWLEVHLYDHPTPFLPKLMRTFERIESEMVMICGHDDFVVPEGLEQAANALDSDPALAAARGRVARFGLRRRHHGASKDAEAELFRHPMRAYEQDAVDVRVLEHVRAYSSTLYSVHRRPLLVQSFMLTESATRNVIFFQYLSSCATVALGKVRSTDALFLVRQAHADSWAGSLLGDYEHWPMLFASPRYSAYYAEFRSALAGLVCDRSGKAAEAFAPELDRAYIDLLRKSFCQSAPDSPEDEAFFSRLGAAGTGENSRLKAVIEFCTRYPDTY